MPADPFTAPDAELPRDRWGRPLITPPEGGDPIPYQRVTTFVGPLEDTYHLSLWKQRMVALGMAARRDLVLSAVAVKDPTSQFGKRSVNYIAKAAVEAAHGTAAALTGTALHSLTERIDAGEELGEVPEEYAADLQAYRDLVTPRLETLAMEGFCVVDDLRIGGSYDRIFALRDPMTDPDGHTHPAGSAFIGDLKTGNVDLGIGKIAMQLACYANAVDYSHTLGTRSPLTGSPSRDWALVIHLPAGQGRARLLWVRLAAAWQTATTVVPEVHAWRKLKINDFAAEAAIATAVAEPPPSLPALIRAAPDRAALVALHTEHSLTWTPGLTSLAKARIEELGV